MRLEGCTTSFGNCNAEKSCRTCRAFGRIVELEKRLFNLEAKLNDQTQIVSTLVYKQVDQYMQHPF